MGRVRYEVGWGFRIPPPHSIQCNVVWHKGHGRQRSASAAKQAHPKRKQKQAKKPAVQGVNGRGKREDGEPDQPALATLMQAQSGFLQDWWFS